MQPAHWTTWTMVVSILFGGFYINAESMPDWLEWLENLSAIKWCFEAYSINEFTGLEFCDSDDNCQTGEDVLILLSFDMHSVWTPTLTLFLLFCCFHCIAFACLKKNRVRYIKCDEPTEKLVNDEETVLTI